MKKVAVILSGCGVYDGSEIHEATLTLLALSKNEVDYQCFAPDKEQFHVINHLTGEITNEKRNILTESARIARGKIKALTELKAENYSAVIFPGGSGVTKNLSTFATEGENYSVDEDVARVIKEFHSAGKPIAALCIAPVIIAKVIGGIITIGNDKITAGILKKSGAIHVVKDYNEVAIDEKNLIVTNPCYMIADSIYKVSQGAEAAVEAMLGLMKR
jgi:enhancing lycopene biosynthesis protein 2